MARLPIDKKAQDLGAFQEKNETLLRAVKTDARDDIKIEIGDSKQADFKPQFKVMRWGNDANFSMRAEEHPEATVEIDKGMVKYKTPSYEVHQYEKPEAGEDGGFEFEWILPARPESNVLRATIETKNLDFFYQPALTQEEIDRGASRPENVIGSYAVYHKKHKNNHFKTGKAFHIYRPEAIDAVGNRTWCEISINERSKELEVTVPEKFLETAVYPVVVDPTFGYTSIGGSIGYVSSGSDSSGSGVRSQVPIDGTLVSLHAAMANQAAGTGSVSWKAGDAAPTGWTFNIVNSGGPNPTTTTPTWYEKTESGQALAGEVYAAVSLFWSGSGGGPNPGIAYDTGGTATGAFYISEIGGYSEQPTQLLSMYVTYTNNSNLPFFENFEGGALPGNFDLLYSGFGAATVEIESGSPLNGAHSIHVTASEEAQKSLDFNMGAPHTELYLKLKVMIPTGFTYGAGGYIVIAGFNDGIGGYFEIKLEDYGTNRLIIQGDTLSYTDTGIDIPADTTTILQVRLLINGASGALQVWVDNEVEGSPDYSDVSENLGTAGMQYFSAGAVYVPNAIGDFYLDDIRVAESFILDPVPSVFDIAFRDPGADFDIVLAEPSAGSTPADDERAAEVTGAAAANAERDAQVTGSATANAERDAQTTGAAAATAERDAEVTGADTSTVERDAEVTGSQTADSERDAETSGQDSATVSRDAEVTGSAEATVERDAEVTGALGAAVERDAEVTGSASASADRDVELTGADTAAVERDAEVHGQDTASVERDAQVTGSADASVERDAELTGALGATVERDAEVSGSAAASADRDAEVHGAQTTNAERDAETSGSDTSTADRDAEVHGTATGSSDRDVEVTGSQADQDERTAEVVGALGASVERDAETHGAASIASTRDAEVHGSTSAAAERDAETHGQDLSTAERDAQVTGSAVASSDREAEVHGSLDVSDDRDVEVTGAAVASSDRAAEVHGQDTISSDREAEATGSAAATTDQPAETSGALAASASRNAEVTGGSLYPYSPGDGGIYTRKPSPYTPRPKLYTRKPSPYQKNSSGPYTRIPARNI